MTTDRELLEAAARAAGVGAKDSTWIVQTGYGLRTVYGLYNASSVAAIVAQARKEALEEAAQIADDVPVHWEHWQTAAAIRAMK